MRAASTSARTAQTPPSGPAQPPNPHPAPKSPNPAPRTQAPHLSYSPAPAKASRSSPFVSLRAMSVPPRGARSAARLLGSDSTRPSSASSGPSRNDSALEGGAAQAGRARGVGRGAAGCGERPPRRRGAPRSADLAHATPLHKPAPPPHTQASSPAGVVAHERLAHAGHHLAKQVARRAGDGVGGVQHKRVVSGDYLAGGQVTGG
jgi:hypothetical protein